jgi:hypothetical protein
MHPALGILAAYVLGSIPFAYLAGRAFGMDLRQHGSGNLGASNVARVVGARLGVIVYVLDTLKGFIAAFALPRLFGLDETSTWAIAYGAAAMIGHVPRGRHRAAPTAASARSCRRTGPPSPHDRGVARRPQPGCPPRHARTFARTHLPHREPPPCWRAVEDDRTGTFR